MLDVCAPPKVHLPRVNVKHQRPDSLYAKLFPSVVLAVALGRPCTSPIISVDTQYTESGFGCFSQRVTTFNVSGCVWAFGVRFLS